MRWFEELQFVSAVPMPPRVADDYGTTVNGMWASPEQSAESVAAAHARGGRVLFSVPLIALTPQVYEDPEHEHLLSEVCADVDGEPSEVDWYYWEEKPVYAACIYSDVFRRYLLARCRAGIERDLDGVNLDEINTSIGLMDRDRGGCGFCGTCLEHFRRHATQTDGAAIAGLDDDALRARLRADDRLYAEYRAFHEREAHATALAFIAEVRALAVGARDGFAITANLAYLGNHVPESGVLWGPMWGPALDFAMFENSYQLARGTPHVLLPRGRFGAWYRLASALTGGTPSWICPSILVPRQLADHKRTTYYELMFLEAYAHRGRWGYYWWPGVSHDARMAATAPERLRDHIRFLLAHRELLELPRPANELAVVYLDTPATHLRYLALAQALAEGGCQFDVLYSGDGEFADDRLEGLERYRAVLLPEVGGLTETQSRALADFAGTVIVPDADVLDRFWAEYRDADRERILATVEEYPGSHVRVSHPAVQPLRYVDGERLVVHLLNLDYDEATDRVAPARDVRVTLPWPVARPATCRLLAVGEDLALEPEMVGDALVVDVPRVDPHAILVVRPR